MNKKSITILVVCLIVSVLSVSLAYYSARIIGDGKNVSVNAKELTINFDNNNEIASGIIEPGWSSANTFSITNKSKTNFTYDIVLKNYKNTTKTNGYLVYKITSTNGYNMTEYKDMPKDGENTYDLVIARGIIIEPGSSNKQSYTLEIKYLDSTEDQSIDMGSTVTGSLYIVESTTNENNPYTKGTLGYQIMEDNTNIKTRTDFSTTYTDTNIGTMYKAKENNTDVYYFAGDARNNWVKFAGYYWRIIRTNADGSIRLLYHGTSVNTEEAYIDTSTYNTNYDNSLYVGYMYGTSGSLENNRTNENNSTIKSVIDTWYANNMASYTKYLSSTAVYCNDREVGSGEYTSTGTTKFYFASYTRLTTDYKPTYDCANINDAFSADNTSAKLTYPIALMTADEISYAGGVWGTNLPVPYAWYYKNANDNSSIGVADWWYLMSPMGLVENIGCLSRVGNSKSPGNLEYTHSNPIRPVRPVISLKKELLYKSGDGSATNPYEIQETPDTLSERLLSDKSTRPSGPRGTGFDKVYTENNTKTLYTSTENRKTVYYFAGNAQDNWVKFAGYYWRIIRTNSDGSIRLLYHGTSTTATDAYIGKSAFNSNDNDRAYVSYMYSSLGSISNARENTTNSTIKKTIDNWYTSNLEAKGYTKYLSTTAVYCNDRSTSDNKYFGAFTRLHTNKTPSYDCAATEDKFTVDASTGNGKLTYPIALMTADEVSFAGGLYGTNAPTWYYYNSANRGSTGETHWWLLSPSYWNGCAVVLYVHGSSAPGHMNDSGVRGVDVGVRPVISIKGDNLWKSGDGTASSPYEIVTD